MLHLELLLPVDQLSGENYEHKLFTGVDVCVVRRVAGARIHVTLPQGGE